MTTRRIYYILIWLTARQALSAARFMRLHGQAVKTPPFHGGNRGSIPLGVTKKISDVFDVRFFYLIFGGGSHPCYAFRFATRTGCTLARIALAERRFPLESPKKFRTFSTSVFSILFWGDLTPVMRFALCDPQQAARSRALRSLKGKSLFLRHIIGQ